MYNLHCHTLLSDGVLLPSEAAVRFAAFGYKAIAVTDHADYSNIEFVVRSTLDFVNHWPKNSPIKVLPGIELTHVLPEQFRPLSDFARKQGIKVIIGHGETVVEPVVKGTNRAAIEAGIDILAHPGLVTDEDVSLAREKNIFLEITSRCGHNRTNRHVVKKALKVGAKMILNIDFHTPEDLITPRDLIKIGTRSGLNFKDVEKIFQDTENFVREKEVR